MLVVVDLVLAQDPPQMSLVPDEGSVQQLASASPDPAFGDRVHAGRPDVAEYGADAGAAASQVLAPIMSRFLDGRPDRSPDLALRQAQPEDRYLLCSDGLNAVVSDDTMRDALKSADDPASIAEGLISLALSRGGPDNITVTLIDVTAQSQEDALPPLVLGAATTVP